MVRGCNNEALSRENGAFFLYQWSQYNHKSGEAMQGHRVEEYVDDDVLR